MALNLRAPFFLAQAAAPHLRAAHGAIVNIADLAAFETWPGYVPHGISKGGVVQMTRALAHVLAPEVRVNGVAPGTVLLPDDWDDARRRASRQTTPLERTGKPGRRDRDGAVHSRFGLPHRRDDHRRRRPACPSLLGTPPANPHVRSSLDDI